MSREYSSIGIKNAQPTGTKGLYICPVTWLPERTHDLAYTLGLVDPRGMVLIKEEWANQTHHARGVCDPSGKEYTIADGTSTTY